MRVCDAAWNDPLDGGHSQRSGGRWNAPGSFPCVYLFAGRDGARAYVQSKYAGLPYGLELLRDESAPQLAEVEVPDQQYADAWSERGLAALKLPVTYPDDGSGRLVSWRACRPIGQALVDEGLPGVSCRSATSLTAGRLRELCFFSAQSPVRLRLTARRAFSDWY